MSNTNVAKTGAIRAIVAATLTAVISILPVFLVGAVAVLIRNELVFDESGLGFVVAVFWGSMAVGGIPGGRLAQRLGATGAVRLGAILGALALIGAASANSFGVLAFWLAVAGLFGGLAHPATDIAITAIVPRNRHSLAFGIKQSSIPAAAALGGLAVPAIALTVGWRWAFLLGAMLSIPAFLVMPRVEAPRRLHSCRQRSSQPKGLLRLAATGAALGMLATTAMAAFFVESVVATGASLEFAGMLLAVGSISGVGARFAFAWRFGETAHPFAIVGFLVGLGAASSLLLGFGPVGARLVIGTILAFGAGWGWNGLFMHAVMRANPTETARATGLIATAVGIGGVGGPMLFGFLVSWRGYLTAWMFIVVSYSVSALTMFLSDWRQTSFGRIT